MTKPTGRPRGRPRKEASEARDEAVRAKAQKDNEETGYLDEVLAKPIRRANTRLYPDEETLRTIGELAKLFCTQEEIAAVLGVSRRAFNGFVAVCQEARDVWEDGLMHAKVSLRRKQLALADKNAPAAIFLGKNYLGQKDEHTSNVNLNKPAQELSEAELMEIATRKSAPAPKPDPKNESLH
jgi:hypothetical protein